MPSDRRRRSRSRSRGRYSDKKPSRRSRSPRKRRSRSRSLRRNRQSRGSKSKSTSPQRNRRRSRSVQRDRRQSRSPLKGGGRSRSPLKDRRRSGSPRQSRSPEASRGSDNVYRRGGLARQSSPVKSSSSTSQKDRRSSRYSHSQSRSPTNRRPYSRKRYGSSRSLSPAANQPSPPTLDDVLMSEKPLSKAKPSLATRYDRYNINVMCLHSKGKSRRSSEEIDNDGSASDFFPTDVIELVHELNSKTSSKRKSKTIFDREEITTFVEEPVETRVIRLAPSADQIRKLEAKLSSKGESSRSQGSKSRDRGSRSSKDSLRREPEKRRYEVTDDDLLGDPAPSTSRLESSKDHKRSIQDRLGSSVSGDRDERPSRRIDDRLGRIPDRPSKDSEKVRSTDLRRNLSSRTGIDREPRNAPIVKDYGHKSLASDATRRSREREPTPDFSKRPDKGKVDMMELDPTYVPRGGLYDEHDDRTRGDWREGQGSWRGRGNWRDRGDWRGRGSWRGRGGYNRSTNRGEEMGDRRSGGPKVFDSRARKPAVADAWKHDKFAELEDDVKVEPTSTTA